MAEFNPTQAERDPLDFSRRSEGARAGGNVAEGVSDTSLGLLFQGLGETITGVTEVANQAIEGEIRSSARDSVDSVQDQFGVNDATDLSVTAGGTSIPPELRKQAEYLQSLKKSADSGNIRSSHYWGLLNKSAKELRSRFPGHTDFIDQTFSGLTGSIPANRVLSEILSEASSTTSQRDGWIEFGIKRGLPPQLMNSLGDLELQSYISQDVRNEKNIELESARLTLEEEQGEGLVKDTIKVARKSAFNLVGRVLQGMGSSTLGKNYKETTSNINRMQERLRSGERLSSKEIEELRGQWGQIRVQLRAAVLDDMIKSIDTEGTTYLSIIGTQGQEEVLGTIDTFLENIEDSLTNQNYGIFASLENGIATGLEQGKLEVLEQLGFRLPALKDVGGETFINNLYLSEPAVRDRITRFTRDGLFADIATGESTSLRGSLKDSQARGEYSPAATNGSVNMLTKGIVDDTATPEFISNAVEGLYGEENLNFLKDFDGASQRILYNKLTQPSIRAKLVKMRDEQGRDDLLQNYDRWVAESFQTLFRTEAADAQSIRVNRQNMDIVWGTESKSFIIVPKDNSGLNLFDRVLDNYNGGQARDSINKLNSAIKPYVKVLEANGENVDVALGQAFQAMGIDFSQNKIEGGFTDNLFENLAGAFDPDPATIEALRGEQKAKDLLSFISAFEAPQGADQVYGGTVPGLSQMTLGEVYKVQTDMIAGQKARGISENFRSSAVGMGQFNQATLKEFATKIGLSNDDVFSPSVQRRLMVALMDDAGLDEYIKGGISKELFGTRLAQRWAALPVPGTSKSYYAGVGNNKALVSWPEFSQQLDALKNDALVETMNAGKDEMRAVSRFFTVANPEGKKAISDFNDRVWKFITTADPEDKKAIENFNKQVETFLTKADPDDVDAIKAFHRKLKVGFFDTLDKATKEAITER